MTEIGAISYAIVGALYAVFSLLLLTSWRGKNLGATLIAACLLSSVWGFMLSERCH